jgi:hypothetical protein
MAKHVSSDDLSRLEETIRHALLRQGLRTHDIARLCPPGLKRDTLTRWLQRMVAEGRLYVTGHNRGTRYSLLPADGSLPAGVSPAVAMVAPAGVVSQSAIPAGAYDAARQMLESAASAYQQLAKVTQGKAMDDWRKAVESTGTVLPAQLQAAPPPVRRRKTRTAPSSEQVHGSRTSVSVSPSSDLRSLSSGDSPSSDPAPASVTPPAAAQPAGPTVPVDHLRAAALRPAPQSPDSPDCHGPTASSPVASHGASRAPGSGEEVLPQAPRHCCRPPPFSVMFLRLPLGRPP